MSTPRKFACLVSPTLSEHEAAALRTAGHDPADYVTLTAGIAQMNMGLAADPRTGQSAWIVQSAAMVEGDALTVKQTAVLDPHGGAASRALQSAVPIGGTVRLVVRRDVLHADLQADAAATPRLNLSAFAPTGGDA
jgi:hypothetical protein